MPTAPRMLLERQEEFREAVEKSRGRIVVLVHPFYDTREEDRLEPKKKEEYEKVLHELVRKNKAPLVVLEEWNKTSTTHTQLDNANAFYVSTVEGTAEPISGWENLHSLFRNAGVNTVLIGGKKGLASSRHGQKIIILPQPIRLLEHMNASKMLNLEPLSLKAALGIRTPKW